jgi:hypothetical protein
VSATPGDACSACMNAKATSCPGGGTSFNIMCPGSPQCAGIQECMDNVGCMMKP